MPPSELSVGSGVCRRNPARHTGQVNEVLLKFLCHNICVLIQEMHELGITSAFGAGAQEFRMAS